MRRALVCGMSGFVLLAACGPSQPAAATHHAFVVVQHLSGSSFERRIDFTGDQIDGVGAMDRSGVEYQAQSVTSGKVVCQIDNEPKSFATCFPPNQPYWALFVSTAGKWTSASSGLSDVKLTDGQAIGWHYVPAGNAAPTPPPMPKGS